MTHLARFSLRGPSVVLAVCLIVAAPMPAAAAAPESEPPESETVTPEELWQGFQDLMERYGRSEPAPEGEQVDPYAPEAPSESITPEELMQELKDLLERYGFTEQAPDSDPAPPDYESPHDDAAPEEEPDQGPDSPWVPADDYDDINPPVLI